MVEDAYCFGILAIDIECALCRAYTSTNQLIISSLECRVVICREQHIDSIRDHQIAVHVVLKHIILNSIDIGELELRNLNSRVDTVF